MAVNDSVEELRREALDAIAQAGSADLLAELKVRYLGRKGPLTAILKGLKDLPENERKTAGALANQARLALEEAFARAELNFAGTGPVDTFDPTLPGSRVPAGTPHVIRQTLDEMCRIFQNMGFQIARGPDVETDYFNFEALNFPPDHPARDMQDTFFVEGGRLLRTHTTPVQARYLQTTKPPIKIISPGLVFRNEAISTRAHVAFHQIDAFLVDRGVTVGDLKGCLVAFCRAYFGDGVRLRFRPSYFPFTEPSAEIDVSCFLCAGEGCQLCKYSGWLEILGSGMVDPNVLDKANIDSEEYTGYAFGIGVERVAMLKHRITDIRHFFNNDIRFLRQFR